jgi:hypothetical protein
MTQPDQRDVSLALHDALADIETVVARLYLPSLGKDPRISDAYEHAKRTRDQIRRAIEIHGSGS